MKPNYVSIIEHNSFYSDSMAGALEKLTVWITENPVDIHSTRYIGLDYHEETEEYIASIDGRYVGNKTLDEVS